MPKAASGFAAGDVHRRAEVGLGLDHAHAAAAAAPARLEHQRIADCRRQLLRAVQIARQRAGAPARTGTPAFARQFARRDLVAEQAHDLGLRADEGDAGLGAGLGEVGILGQEAVAGMDRIDLRFLGDADDVVDVEVGRDRFLAGADQVGLVGLEAVQGEAVFVGVDGDGADAQFAGGAQDADGDFAAVGDQEAADLFHGGREGEGGKN